MLVCCSPLLFSVAFFTNVEEASPLLCTTFVLPSLLLLPLLPSPSPSVPLPSARPFQIDAQRRRSSGPAARPRAPSLQAELLLLLSEQGPLPFHPLSPPPPPSLFFFSTAAATHSLSHSRHWPFMEATPPPPPNRPPDGRGRVYVFPRLAAFFHLPILVFFLLLVVFFPSSDPSEQLYSGRAFSHAPRDGRARCGGANREQAETRKNENHLLNTKSVSVPG